MITVQENFAHTLMGSAMSMRKRYEAVKAQTHKSPEVKQFPGGKMETVEYPVSLHEGVRRLIVGRKVVKDNGTTTYSVEEKSVQLSN